MKYAVVTFGCRVNQADSLGFEEQLRARGATPDSAERADLVIVNTCSVTASADQSARQTVRRLLRSNPDAKVVVTGCYATRKPDEFRDMPNVLRVVPNDDKPRLIDIIGSVRLAEADLWRRRKPDLTTADRFGDGDGSCGAPIEPGVAGRTAFTLRVQTGCSQPCAYCIIPTTRGRPRSVPVDEVLAEIDRVASAGFKEIALTGVHLGSYGRDLIPTTSLIDLLRAIESRHGLKTVPYRDDGSGRSLDRPIVRFRLSSLEPMDCSPEIVDLVAASECFARHFHLPLQHASDRLLADMRRPYTIDFYRSLVDRIRTRMPDVSIGSDLIVGFPGERDEDVDELCAYLEGSPLTHLHVFPYSDRPGTAASVMDGKVPGGVIRARAARLRDIGHRLTTTFRASQLGSVHRALTLEDGTLAVTGNYLKVRIPPGHARNEWLSVRVTTVGEAMTGEVYPPTSVASCCAGDLR